MANIYIANPMVIDTFTSALDWATAFPKGQKIESIEWCVPTSTDHEAYVQVGGSSGPKIFNAKCSVVSQNVIKYFYGQLLKPLYIPAAASNLFASGSLIITLSGQGGAVPS